MPARRDDSGWEPPAKLLPLRNLLPLARTLRSRDRWCDRAALADVLLSSRRIQRCDLFVTGRWQA
jgi:hypothetical protein